MWTSDSVMLIDDVSSKLAQAMSDLIPDVVAPYGDADVASAVGKMIAHDGPILPSAIDNLHEGVNRFRF
jgi:hypothetical protein